MHGGGNHIWEGCTLVGSNLRWVVDAVHIICSVCCLLGIFGCFDSIWTPFTMSICFAFSRHPRSALWWYGCSTHYLPLCLFIRELHHFCSFVKNFPVLEVFGRLVLLFELPLPLFSWVDWHLHRLDPLNLSPLQVFVLPFSHFSFFIFGIVLSLLYPASCLGFPVVRIFINAGDWK